MDACSNNSYKPKTFNCMPLPLSITVSEEFEDGSVLLSSQPNWFYSQATDSRAFDRLFVAASFKNIVVYRVNHGVQLPEILKCFFHAFGKVLLVRIYPDASNAVYQNHLLTAGEYGNVTLYNAETCQIIGQHSQHKDQSVGGLCWLPAAVSSDGGGSQASPQAVSVGSNGRMVVWDLETNITRSFTLTLQVSMRGKTKALTPSLGAVELVPGTQSRVLVAAERILIVVETKDGTILSQLRGHDHKVYCFKWFKSSSNCTTPLVNETFNKRAQALCSGAAEVYSTAAEGSSSSNWRIRERSAPSSDIAEASTDIAEVSTDINEASADISEASIDAALSSQLQDLSCSSSSCKLIFASSDLGANVMLWDLNALKYISKFTLPSAAKKRNTGGPQKSSPLHCSLEWHGPRLLTNSAFGEVFAYSFHTTQSAFAAETNDITRKNSSSSGQVVTTSSRVIHKEHSRAVFTMDVIGSTLVTSSQDRCLIGYCLSSHKLWFKLPTLGSPINTISFCPHDSSWLALGLQEFSIRLLNIHSSPPMNFKNIVGGIKGKVMALQWHPKLENKILFGTGLGQVGIADANSLQINSFSFFHQKPVYKVEWAPRVPNGITAQEDLNSLPLFAYSFGDRDVVMRDPSNFLGDEVKLNTLNSDIPENVSEFSFSADFKYLSIGCVDGLILILRTSDLKVLLKLMLVRKSIQHLLWKNSLPDEKTEATTYCLAVASNDTKICISELSHDLRAAEAKVDDTFEPIILSSCSRELCGHLSRAVWLSFSPHQPNLLASASYDHTCQVWDVSTGEQLGNYRGHLTRVFRVEWSPNEAGLLYSFAEESLFHCWRMNGLQYKSPPSKPLKSLEAQPVDLEPSSSKSADSASPFSSNKSSFKPSSVDSKEVLPHSSSSSRSKRVQTHKSLFPLLHSATSHKRSFYLLSVLCLARHSLLLKATQKQEEVSLDDLLDEDRQDESEAPSVPGPLSLYESVAQEWSVLLEPETNAPHPPNDMETFLQFYGLPEEVLKFCEKQKCEHWSAGNTSLCTVLSSWQGSLDRLLKTAISEKKLTQEMMALAPQVPDVVACEAFAAQLETEGEFVAATLYLLAANKVTEAVQLLTKHKLHREALFLAKVRLPYSTDLHTKVTETFAASATHEGNFDLGATLYASAGELSAAASSLCRRGDPSSLLVAGVLYSSTQDSLAVPTLLECVKQSTARGEMERANAVLEKEPRLNWFKVILDAIELLTTGLEAGKPLKAVDGRSRVLTSSINDGVSSVDALKKSWMSQEWSTKETYHQLLDKLGTSIQPMSVKHFWYLVGVELCKLLLCESEESGTQHLLSLTQLMQDWGKPEYIYEVTHRLMPKGARSVPECLSTVLSTGHAQVFHKMYYLSEFHVKSSMLLNKVADNEAGDQSHQTLDGSTTAASGTVTLELIELVGPMLECLEAVKEDFKGRLCEVPLFNEPLKVVKEVLDKLASENIIGASLRDELLRRVS